MRSRVTTESYAARVSFREGKHLRGQALRVSFGNDHMSDIFPVGVEHIDLSKSGGHSPVRNGGDLLRLPFAAIESASEMIFIFATDAVAGIPEIHGIPLISDVAQHLADLAIFDLIEKLAAKLEVVTLLINAPTAITDDVDAVLHIGNELVDADLCPARLEGYVRHSLNRKGIPAIRKTAAIGLLAADL